MWTSVNFHEKTNSLTIVPAYRKASLMMFDNELSREIPLFNKNSFTNHLSLAMMAPQHIYENLNINIRFSKLFTQ